MTSVSIGRVKENNMGRLCNFDQNQCSELSSEKNENGVARVFENPVEKPPVPKIYIKNLKSLQYEIPKQRGIVNSIIRTLNISSNVVQNTEPELEESPERKSTRMRKRAASIYNPEPVLPTKRRSTNVEPTPGLLPTPKAANSADGSSAFVSRMCDGILSEFQTDFGSLLDSEMEDISRKCEDSMTFNISTPPKIRTPPLLLREKPRTVAEKRALLAQSSLEYSILDTENTVYHLIKKREKEHNRDLFRSRVCVLLTLPTPVKRDVWRAITWLNSDVGYYNSASITIDQDTVKLPGWRGRKSHIKPVFSVDINKTRPFYLKKCPKSCDKSAQIPFIRNQKTILLAFKPTQENADLEDKLEVKDVKEVKTILNGVQSERTCLKPGPLCSKIKHQNRAIIKDNLHLGPLEIYQMPPHVIAVTPEINKKQSKWTCSYLKLAIPEDSLNEEWLRFSMSVVQAGDAPPKKETHNFVIPYENNQRNILVRRFTPKDHHCRNESYEEQFKIPLTFPEKAPPPSEEDKDLRSDVVNILTEMIDSVAMSYCEDSFIKNDPDLEYKCDYPQIASAPIIAKSEESQNLTTIKRKRQGDKVLMELRRLNATIIDAQELPKIKECTSEHCKLGCLCDSIETFSAPSKHCMNMDCIFGCRCVETSASGPLGGSGDGGGGSLESQVQRIRDKKTSQLARVEKEFRSTVVLTNTNTFLMTNAEEGKRNRVKPKRFGDYLFDNSNGEDENEDNNSGDEKTTRRRLMKWLPELDKFRHCSVVLPKIRALDQVKTWCMVHELYNCYCDNQGLFGKPFTGPEVIQGVEKEPKIHLYKKRQYSFAKDENQDVLERMTSQEPVPEPVELETAARCNPVDSFSYMHKNQARAPRVRDRIKKCYRKETQRRLELLVDNCSSYEYMKKLRIESSKEKTPSPAQTPITVPLITEESNDLGLKISSICSLPEDRDDPREGSSKMPEVPLRSYPPVTQEPPPLGKKNTAVSELRQKLLDKLIDLQKSMKETNLHYPKLNHFTLFKMNALVNLLNLNLVSVYEVWTTKSRPILVLTSKLVNISDVFPGKESYDVLEKPEMAKTYVSKFMTRGRPSSESNNVYAILVRTGNRVLEIRGCQYVKPVEKELTIKASSLNKIEEYVRRCVNTESNIKMMDFEDRTNKLISLPLPRYSRKRWLMLQLAEDFSDVSHPSWQGLLTFNIIKKAIKVAAAEKKTLNLLNGQLPNVYAVPNSANRIFVGPYDLDEPSQIVLYQRVDNDLLTREMYEQMSNVTRDVSTVGFWLYVEPPNGKSGQISKPFVSNSRNDSDIAERRRRESSTISESSDKSSSKTTTATTAPVREVVKQLPDLEIIPLAQNEETPKEKPKPSLDSPDLSIYTMSKPSASETQLKTPSVPPLLLTSSLNNIKKGIIEKENSSNRSLLKPQVKTFVLPPCTVLSLEQKSNPAVPPLATKLPDSINQILAELREKDVSQVRLGKTIVIKKHSPVVPNPGPSRLSVSSTGSAKSDVSQPSKPILPALSPIQTVQTRPVEEVIELSDDDDDEEEEEVEEPATEPVMEPEPAPGPITTPVSAELAASHNQTIPLSGYYSSNIKNLGNIPAKIFNDVVSLFLPIRKMPVKIGVGCVNRYMDRYMRNAVCTYLPRNLDVKWEFVNSYFPKNDQKFHLEATEDRKYKILTEYGVVDMSKDDLEEEYFESDGTIYLKYLIFKLCFVVYDGLNPVTGLEIINEAVTNIGKLQDEEETLLIEKTELQDKHAELLQRKAELQPEPTVIDDD